MAIHPLTSRERLVLQAIEDRILHPSERVSNVGPAKLLNQVRKLGAFGATGVLVITDCRLICGCVGDHQGGLFLAMGWHKIVSIQRKGLLTAHLKITMENGSSNTWQMGKIYAKEITQAWEQLKNVPGTTSAPAPLVEPAEGPVLIRSAGYLAPLHPTQPRILTSALATKERLIILQSDASTTPTAYNVVVSVPWPDVSHFTIGAWPLPSIIDPAQRERLQLSISIPPQSANDRVWVATDEISQWASMLTRVGIRERKL